MQLSTYAIRDMEEYKNFCDRPRDQRPQPEEVIGVSILATFILHTLSLEASCFRDLSLLFGERSGTEKRMIWKKKKREFCGGRMEKIKKIKGRKGFVKIKDFLGWKEGKMVGAEKEVTSWDFIHVVCR